MLFNSYEFIFLFLPVTFAGYFLLGRRDRPVAALAWLAAASLCFYGWWNPAYLLLLGSSIAFNYLIGSRLGRSPHATAGDRRLLLAGVAGNLLALGYFKYANFFLANVGSLFGGSSAALEIALPLGISFFTFTQIAYLVDAYRKEVRDYRLLDYTLFVTFFPHLIAGPILHHKDIMPQFAVRANLRFSAENFARGLFIFAVGLGKKVLVADTLAPWANVGFEHAASLAAVEAWFVVLSYAMQLYFDFSGYCDMAIGIGLMFNIRLPINFDSPYRSRSIQEFWRRWHVTLSRFLRDYLYISLGGNRGGLAKTCRNLFVTFVLGGLWHGAGWTFVIWGAIHGGALVIQRVFAKSVALPAALGWLLTFLVVVFAWVFFRSTSMEMASSMIAAMTGFNGAYAGDATSYFVPVLRAADVSAKPWILAFALGLAILGPNSNRMVQRFEPTFMSAVAASVVLIFALGRLTQPTEFIYFNF